MTTSTPLPEQGGFNERLDVLRLRYDCDGKFVDAIRTLVLEEIIGEDDRKHDPEFMGRYYDVKVRNLLRAEQRKKLEGTHGTK